MKRLLDFPTVALAFVGMEAPTDLALFRDRMRSPHTWISDPDRTLYRLFEMPEGRLGQLIGPAVWIKGFSVLRHGNSRPTSDPMQLGGAVVLDADGKPIWVKRSRNAADLVSQAELSAAMAPLDSR